MYVYLRINNIVFYDVIFLLVLSYDLFSSLFSVKVTNSPDDWAGIHIFLNFMS